MHSRLYQQIKDTLVLETTIQDEVTDPTEVLTLLDLELQVELAVSAQEHHRVVTKYQLERD